MSAVTLPSFEFSGLDCLATGAMVLDATDHIQYVNPATETLLGVSGVLLVGIGLLLVTNRLTIIAQYFSRLFPGLARIG